MHNVRFWRKADILEIVAVQLDPEPHSVGHKSLL
jgi:hypothetical protein